MDEKISSYLAEIVLGEPNKNRVRDLIFAFEFLKKEDIGCVFLSEFASGEDNDGLRWESLWGFSANYWFQARSFTKSDEYDIDVSPLKDSVSYIGVRSKGFAYKDGKPEGITDTSAMSLEIESGDHFYNPLAASGINCKALCAIVTDILSKNLRTTLS